MAAKKGDDKAKGNRWNSDPMALNAEAHDLPPEKQRMALDFMEEATPELRAKLAPMWQFCFVQWHVYDTGLEALDNGRSLRQGFEDELLHADIEALQTLFTGGDLDQAATAEKWTWKLLEHFPPAGSIEPWTDEVAAPMLKVGRDERKEGVVAFEQERYDKAFWHFWQGLKLVARAPGTLSGPFAKLRCDLHKNQSAAALKLGMPRASLGAANAALSVNMRDEKAWYRKSSALQALGHEAEATAAMQRAGLGAAPQAAEPQGQPQEPLVLPELGELELPLHRALEALVFVEVGVDSIAALDLLMHIQAELRSTPIAPTLVFDCPTIFEAVTVLLSHINAADELFYRQKMNSTVWRALCRALGRDPVLDSVRGRKCVHSWPQYSEDEAIAVLLDLKAAYQQDSWVQVTKDLARKVAFEQRSFLVNLRSRALQVQRPVLSKHGFDPDADGLRSLECATVNAAIRSTRVDALLQEVRIALQGGPNGMWTVNMDPEEAGFWDDSRSMESRSQYARSDPFGPRRVNTNSVYSAPIAA